MAEVFKPIPQLSDSDKERFLAKVSKVPTPEGCLDWTAGRLTRGYGQYWARGKQWKANRIAYFLATGVDPEKLQVNHSCDRPECCNPEHLSLGTHEDNMADRQRKGRNNPPKGEAAIISKLTTADIIAIRFDTRRQFEIAESYGVNQSNISRIIRGEAWAHIPFTSTHQI